MKRKNINWALIALMTVALTACGGEEKHYNTNKEESKKSINVEEKKFEVLGLAFGSSLDEIKNNRQFQCQELEDSLVACKTSVYRLDIQDNLKYLDKIVFYFEKEKFIFAKMYTNVFEEWNAKSKAKEVLSYLEDIFDITNFPNTKTYFDIHSDRITMMAKMGVQNYSASNMAGIKPFFVEFRILDIELFNNYVDRVNSVKNQEKEETKEKLNIFKKEEKIDNNTKHTDNKIIISSLKYKEDVNLTIIHKKEKNILTIDFFDRGTISLLLNGKLFYSTPENYGRSEVPLAYANITTKNMNLIILENHPGGNGDSLDYLFILIKNGKPIVLKDKKAFNHEYKGKKIAISKENIQVFPNKILVELGFVKGKKRVCKIDLNRESLSVIDRFTKSINLPKELCNSLYQNFLSECDGTSTCSRIEELTPNKHEWWNYIGGFAVGRMVKPATDYPNFPDDILLNICKNTCKTGKKPLFNEFKKEVCE